MSDKKLLKNCPFCGGENIRMYAFGISPDCGIICDDCGGCLEKEVAWKQEMTQKEHDEECKKVLIEAWNTRKPMERIVEELELKQEESYKLYAIEFNAEDRAGYDAYSDAIDIVKEEGGLNDCF